MTDLTDREKAIQRFERDKVSPLWDQIDPDLFDDDTFWDEVEKGLIKEPKGDNTNPV